MQIEVMRSGGFAGLTLRAEVDTDLVPDGAVLVALAVDSGWADGGTPTDETDSLARDVFVWRITVDSRPAVRTDTALSGAIRDLAERTLAEGWTPPPDRQPT